MTKKIICLLLCLVTVFSLTACGLLGGKDTPATTEPTETTQPTENVEKPVDKDEATEPEKPENTEPSEITEITEYREGSVEHAAQMFIKSLVDGDFEAAVRCFAVPAETPYFTATDVEWYLPRSQYADVLDITYTNYDIVAEKLNHASESADCSVKVVDKDSDKSKEFVLHLVLDNTNKWGVQDNAFYLNEYWVVAPGGTAALTINDAAAPDYDSKFGSTQYQYMYKLTYVGKAEKVLKVTHDNFTDEEKVFPVENSSNEPYKMVVAYDDNTALNAVKDIWMELHQAAIDGKSYSEMIHVLSPSANTEIAKSAMDGLTAMLDGGKCYDFGITKMTFAPQKPGQETKWLAADKLQVCFNYTLNWMYKGYGDPGSESMNDYEILVLHYDGEKFTLDTILENRIFVHRDSWRSDFLD